MTHTRGGHHFWIDSGRFPRPFGKYRFFAKVTRAVRHGKPTEDVTARLPFRPFEHWGVNRADAIADAIMQIDDWYDAHPDADQTRIA